MDFSYNNQSVLITGGTGSLGNALLQTLLSSFPDLKRIVIYSRDELKQFEQRHQYVHSPIPIEWRIGDVRDYERLLEVCKEIDIIFHVAALKHVHSCESNPQECIKTNYDGSIALLKAAEKRGVQKLIAVSTDKAVAPISTYGASKLLMERSLVNANQTSNVAIAIARFGNFAASRGSVLPLFLARQQAQLPLEVTDWSMTRFCMTEHEAAQLLVEWSIQMQGGELFVPKMKSYALRQILQVLGAEETSIVIGKRPGEKLHEQLIGMQDTMPIDELANYYVLQSCKEGSNKAFVYQSDKHDQRYTNAELRVLLEYVRQSCLIAPAGTTSSKITSTKASKTTTIETAAPVP